MDKIIIIGILICACFFITRILCGKYDILHNLYISLIMAAVIIAYGISIIPDVPVLLSGGVSESIQIKDLKHLKMETTIIDSNDRVYYTSSYLNESDLGYGKNKEYIIEYLPNSRIVLSLSSMGGEIYNIWFGLGGIIVFLLVISSIILLSKTISTGFIRRNSFRKANYNYEKNTHI